MWSLNLWTAREVPNYQIFKINKGFSFEKTPIFYKQKELLQFYGVFLPDLFFYLSFKKIVVVLM